MKNRISHARVAVLPLALVTAFAASAQTTATLPEVRVTATRFDAAADELPFGVSVVTAQDIRRAGVSTVNEAIMKLLGVPGRQDSYGGGDYALDLRGFGSTAASNQVVVLDGIRLNEADLGGTRLAGIAIDSVERIEVIRGSGAVLYGEGAAAGVIVITTQAGKGVARTNTASLYTAGGTNGLGEARATGTLAVGGFSLDLSAGKRQSDNHRKNFSSVVDSNAVTGQWSNDWLRLGARHSIDQLTGGLPGALTAAKYQADPTQANSLTTSASIKNESNSVFADATLGAWQLGVDVGQRHKALDSLNNNVPTYQYLIDADNLGLRAQQQARVAGLANVLTFGYDQTDWTRKVLGAFGSVATQKTQAVYIKDSLTLGRGTRLEAGLRSQAMQQQATATSASVDTSQRAWELGLTQPLSTAWSAFARVGTSFRVANVDEVGFTVPGAVLQAQTSRDVELGARWRNTSGSRAELRLYRSALTNELGYDPTVANSNSFSGLGANVNFDPTLRQGVELELHHELTPTVGMGLNAGVRQARFVAGAHNGNTVPLVPKTTVALRGDWRPAQGHRVDGGVNWVSGQSPDFANVCSMPAYSTADVRYAYQWGKAELAVGVNNLTDSKYYTQAFGCAAGVTTSIYPEAGRTAVVSLRLQF